MFFIGNNLVNVGASTLATKITIDLVFNNAVGIATLAELSNSLEPHHHYPISIYPI